MADLKAFFPNGMAAFKETMERAAASTSLARPELDFSDAARGEGVMIDGIAIADGKIHRCPYKDSKAGSQDAWYVLYADGDIAAGAFGNWKGMEFQTTWRADIGRKLTFLEEAEHRRRMEAIKESARIAREVAHREAAEKAADDVARWVDATDEHPYLVAKGVKAHPGTKMDAAARLIIPYQNADGTIQTYQAISSQGPDFDKRFLKGGQKQGSFFEIRGDRTRVFICEGYSTASTVHEATGATVIVAGGAGSLSTVAKIVRDLFPAAKMYVGADNDAFTPDGNPGLLKGKQAAKDCNGEMVYPIFSAGDVEAFPGGKPTDWNDLKKLRGIDGVITQIEMVAKRGNPASAGFQFVRGDGLTLSSIDWLVKDSMETDSLALMFGDPGCGKSFVAIDIACCIATGTNWNGREVKQGPVFYIAGEGHQGIARRLKAWEIGNGISLKDAPIYKSKTAALLTDGTQAAIVSESIRSICEQLGIEPSAIILDTVARNYGGDENSTEDMADFITNIDRHFREPFGCTVLMVHHSGVADKDRSRGSSALKGALDAEYKVSLDATSGIIRMECKKMKEAEMSAPIDMMLTQVDLPIYNDRGEPEKGAFLNGCTNDVSAIAKKAKDAGKYLGKNQQVALTVLAGMIHSKTASGEIEHSPPAIDEWRVACGAHTPPMDRKRFAEAKDALLSMGKVEEFTGGMTKTQCVRIKD